MEKAVSADSAMSTGREDTVSGNTTLIEGDGSKAVEANKGDRDVPSEEGSPKIGGSGMEVDADVTEDIGADKGKGKEDRDEVSKGGAPGGRDLGKLFNVSLLDVRMGSVLISSGTLSSGALGIPPRPFSSLLSASSAMP
jgi:hypothetical protein